MRLCYACQRPTWTQAADIGSWYTVLNILGYAAVLTNATMIAFVGSQFTNDDDEATLLGINERFNRPKLWVIAVVIEHGVLLARIVLEKSSPTVPTWLVDAHNILEFRKGQMVPFSQVHLDEIHLKGSNTIVDHGTTLQVRKKRDLSRGSGAARVSEDQTNSKISTNPLFDEDEYDEVVPDANSLDAFEKSQTKENKKQDPSMPME
jgi:hypothetical protein